MPVTSDFDMKKEHGEAAAPKVNHLALMVKSGDRPEAIAIPPGATLMFVLPEEGEQEMQAHMMPMVLVKVKRTSLTFKLAGTEYVFSVSGVKAKEIRRRR